jgi:hypothetical protein
VVAIDRRESIYEPFDMGEKRKRSTTQADQTWAASGSSLADGVLSLLGSDRDQGQAGEKRRAHDAQHESCGSSSATASADYDNSESEGESREKACEGGQRQERPQRVDKAQNGQR